MEDTCGDTTTTLGGYHCIEHSATFSMIYHSGTYGRRGRLKSRDGGGGIAYADLSDERCTSAGTPESTAIRSSRCLPKEACVLSQFPCLGRAAARSKCYVIGLERGRRPAYWLVVAIDENRNKMIWINTRDTVLCPSVRAQSQCGSRRNLGRGVSALWGEGARSVFDVISCTHKCTPLQASSRNSYKSPHLPHYLLVHIPIYPFNPLHAHFYTLLLRLPYAFPFFSPKSISSTMPRGNDAQTKVHYKGKDEDFVIFVDSAKAVQDWKEDSSVPLAQVVSGWKVFVTHK